MTTIQAVLQQHVPRQNVCTYIENRCVDTASSKTNKSFRVCIRLVKMYKTFWTNLIDLGGSPWGGLCSRVPFKIFALFPCSHLKKSKVFTVFRLRHLRLLICLPAQPVTVDSREVRYFILQGYGGSSPINVKDGHNPLPQKDQKIIYYLDTTHIFYLQYVRS